VNTETYPFEGGIPTLQTDRLILRPFTPVDGPRVKDLAGAREIADTTLNIPHPYPEGAAENWINGHAQEYAEGKGLTLAVTLRDGALIGAISLLGVSSRHRRAEIGYWIGKDFWGHGYCTEAAGSIVSFGFTRMGLNRVYGHHMTRNPASGNVMKKIGMTHEGTLRRHLERWGRFEDIECWGILASEESDPLVPRAGSP
jgi:[ribosomal protein S5]-alanine N-acetyltransferase